MRALLIAALWSACAFAAAAPVVLVPLEGAIGPASAHFVKRAIERAAKEGAELVIVQGDHLTAVGDPAFRNGIRDFLDKVSPR